MKPWITSRDEKGEVIVKLAWLFYPLLGFLVFLVLLFFGSLYLVYMAYVRPDIIIDLPSALLVFGIAFILYAGTFIPFGNIINELQMFKLRWLQEVSLLAGILGAILGILIISRSVSLGLTGEDMAAAMGGGMAVALFTLLYGLLGATGFYLIEKLMHTKEETKQFESHPIKPGFNLRASLGLLFYILLLVFLIWILSAKHGTEIRNLFFNVSVVYLMITFLVVSIFVYNGKILLRALIIPFWRGSYETPNLVSSLKAVRGCKRIIVLMGLIAVLVNPIGLLMGMGGAENFQDLIFTPLIPPGIILFWCFAFIFFLQLVEGQFVQQIYFQNGEVYYEDRLFILKFILPTFLLLFLSSWLISVLIIGVL